MEIFIIQGFAATATPRIIFEETVRSLDFQYWSLGNLIVNEIKNYTSLGQLAKSIMDKDELLPFSLVQEIIENAVNQCEEKKGIFMDGFARTPHQAALQLDFLLQNPDNKVRGIFLHTPKEAIIARLKPRHNWEDSDEVLFMERLNRIEYEAHEIKTYLESRIEVVTINGEGTIDEVVSRVLDVL
jgi:adenylate kinase